MKIVFFGDSNTWGYDPETGAKQKGRFTELVKQAHPEWEIIEEGLNGRTLADDDPYSLPRNGAKQISQTIRTHTPYDILVVMLGSNDAKRLYSTNSHMLERALYHFLDEATNPAMFRRSPYEPGKILLVQPPQIRENGIEYTYDNFGQAGIDMMKNAGEIYERAAKIYDTDILRTDGENPIMGGHYDGLHLEKEQHRQLADLLIPKLEAMQKETEASKS